MAQNFLFGWIVVCGLGDLNPESDLTTHVSNNHVELDTLLKRFWQIEEPSTQCKRATDEEIGGPGFSLWKESFDVI